MSARPCVLVYRNQLLPISEQFVYNQTMHLDRYEVHFLGAKRLQGPAAIRLPPERLYLINSGGFMGLSCEIAFKLLGVLPPGSVHWARQREPALVHAHFGPDGAVVMPLAKRLGLPLVVSFHGSDAAMKDLFVLGSSYVTHRLYLLRRARLARHCARAVVPSKWLRGLVVSRQGFSEDRVTIIRHGVDLEFFRPEAGTTEWGQILYVGRLVERKGLPFLIEALHLLQKEQPGIRLTVIGDGPMRARYEQLARDRLGDRVNFLGAQPQPDVRSHLQRAYLFCMPSITVSSGEAEALGVVFLEAMAMKVPPVSYRSGGIPEVVLHGRTGFLAEEGDIGGLAHHLSVLLQNRGLRDEMGEAGRKWVEREFDLREQNAKLEALYDEVISEHRHGHGRQS